MNRDSFHLHRFVAVLFAVIAGYTVQAQLAITTKSLPDARQHASYRRRLAAANGAPRYSWSLAAGNLPAGLALDTTTGIISGAPSRIGTSAFTVQVKDAHSSVTTKPLRITVRPAGLTASILLWSDKNPSYLHLPVTLSAEVYGASDPLPTGTVSFQDGSAQIGNAALSSTTGTNFLLFSSQFDNSAWWLSEGSVLTPGYATSPLGDQTAYRFQNNSGMLEQDVEGLPGSQPATFSIWIKSNTDTTQEIPLDIMDYDNGIDNTVSVSVTPGWQRFSVTTASPTTSVGASIGTNDHQELNSQWDISVWGAQVESSNSMGPYISTTTNGRTATSVSTTFSTDVLTEGSHSVTANYSGDGNYDPSTSTPLEQHVNQIVITTYHLLPEAAVGLPYSVALTALGGRPPYTWAIGSGYLPDGLTLNSDGTITGTPTGESYGHLDFVIQVSDSKGLSRAKLFELEVLFYDVCACPGRRAPRPNDCSAGGYLAEMYPNESARNTAGENINLCGCLGVDPNDLSVGTITLNLPPGFSQVGDITAFYSNDRSYSVHMYGTINIGNSASLGANGIGVHQVLDGCEGDSTNTLPYYVVPDPEDPGPCDGDCEENAGAPINLTNGDTWMSKTEYSVPGLAGGLSLTRTWNSLWGVNQPPFLAGMFGSGWTSSFEERLQSIGQNQIEYWRSTGNRWLFQQPDDCPTCGYLVASPPNQHAALTYNSLTGMYNLTFADGTSETFNSNGYLLTMADRNGNQTTLTYDITNRLTNVTAAGGQSLSFTYGLVLDPGRVTSMQDSVGNVATYTYVNSALTQAAYPDGSQLNYTYDASGNITSVTDAQGKLIEAHTYDNSGRGLTSVRANGVDSITVRYSAGVATLTDSASNSTAYAYAPVVGKNFLTSIAGPGCDSCGGRNNHAFTLDAAGNRLSNTDANGNTVNFTYDSMGNVLTKTDSVGSWTYTYNGFGEVLTARDPLGNTTTYVYDNDGNLLSVTTPPPGATTQYAYDGKGELTQITDPLGNATHLSYYSSGLVHTVTDAQSNVTTFTYDGRGNRLSTQDALSNVTSFAYDALNRLTEITYPDTTTTQFGYDTRGRRTSVMDGNGKTTSYTYDDADRLTQVLDAASNATTYGYDTENNLTSITDALSRTTSFSYDALGRVTQTTSPSTLVETYGYDSNGNLTSKVDRNGNTLQYTYDAVNRLTQKNYTGNSIAYGYDNNSRLTSVTDSTGTYQFTYDPMGRLTGTTTNYTFLPNQSLTTSYSYDAASNRISFQNTGDGQTTYAYDTLNRLASITNSHSMTFTYGYDPLSRRTSLTRSNGITSTYTYDSRSRLLSVLHKLGATTFDGAAYTVDPVGNRLTRQTLPSGVPNNYTYDPIYELVTATQGGTTKESYTYDAVGNRLSSLLATYTYNSSNEIASASNAAYTYDNNGNVLTKVDSTGTTSYTWDAENRLSQVVLPGTAGTVTFKYDPFGRRIEKVSSSGTTIFNYDGPSIVQTVSASGGILARYTQGLTIDEPLALLPASTLNSYFYEADGLGSVTSLTNTIGSVSQAYSYDSFGKTTVLTLGSIGNSFRYTGREFDSETGLYYYRGRYYDPTIGKFISEDPSGFKGGIDFYNYVANNPANLTDPFGLKKCKKPCDVTVPPALADAIDTLLGEESPNAMIGHQQYQYGDAYGKPTGANISEDTLDSESYLIASTMVNRGNQRGKTLDEVVSQANAYSAYTGDQSRLHDALASDEDSALCIMLHRALDALMSAINDPGDYLNYRAQVIPGNPPHVLGYTGGAWVGRTVFGVGE